MIYGFKAKGRSSKYFRDYQNPIELFKNLRNGNVKPKEVLKNQMNFKSDLSEIRKEANKSENQKNTKNIDFFLIFEKKLLIFFEIILFRYLKLNRKYNWEKTQNINS